ncbi:MAG TPA: hypothetical protein VLT87_28025 [Thermoanaerobaculia bacterium]|nr:hypothetical protein [Thermoanaerobaculia bacterium]
MTAWSPVDLLPGLWVGLLAAFLAAALRRGYDPVPARVLFANALVLLILFGPVLFGGQLLLPLDTLRGQVPFQSLSPTEPHGNVLQGDLIELVGPSSAAVREAWEAGRWPLWNPRVGAGMPLLADPQAQALQPLVLLGYALPWARAAAVTAALRVFLALVFTFLFLRRQGMGEGPAAAGAFAWGLGGFLLLWLGWPIANAAVFLPLLLYAAARCDEVGGRRDKFLLALGALALLLGGHPETAVYVLALTFAFLLDRARRRPPGTRLRLLRDAGLVVLLAGAVAAPVLLPFLDLLPHTLRASRLEEVPGKAGSLALRWLQIAAPNAFGNSRYIHYWGIENSNEDASGFVGTATLLAALLGVGARRKLPQEWMFLGIATLCFLLLGIPGVSRRLLLLLGFSLVYLAVCTLERFRRGEARRWPVLLVAAGLGAVIAWGYLGHPHPEDPNRLAPLRIGWLHWQGRFLVLAVLLLLTAGTWRRKGAGRLAVAGIAVLVAAELLKAHGPANPPMPKRLSLPETEPVRFLQASLEVWRKAGPGYRMAALGRAFPPNVASLYGIPDARIYNPMMPREYVELTAPLTVRWQGESPQFGNIRHPLYRRLGVKYILTPPGVRLRPPLKRVLESPDGWIWERPGARPRLFLEDAAPGDRLNIPLLDAQHLTARVRSAAPRRLGSNLYQDGGWRLLVDGRLYPATREAGVFLAADLPQGEPRLDLVYRPGVFLWGCLIAALGLAAGGAWLVPPPVRP